jgi:hypothetical protein
MNCQPLIQNAISACSSYVSEEEYPMSCPIHFYIFNIIIIIIILLSFTDKFRFTQPLDTEIVSGLHDILPKIIKTRGKQQLQYIRDQLRYKL